MTTSTDPTAAAGDAVLRALCWPPPPDQPHLPDWPVRDSWAGLGGLIERAILHKVLCLLADRLVTTGLDRDLPRAISRFLVGTLRANQYKTSIYRTETARIMVAVDQAGLTAAALNGIAAESSLYGGRGARQFSDLDVLLAPEHITVVRTVLTDLGYHSSSPVGTTLTRRINDILVPRITIDLTQSMHHAPGEDGVREILSRRIWQPLPGHGQPLPVLAAPDALLYCLTRLDRTTLTEADTPQWAICADALRLVRACENLPAAHWDPAPLVPAAAAGWARLRRIWPQLPPMPLSAQGAGVTSVGPVGREPQ
ncbi:MAG: nucleotidyltransferase family protein [Pseudonocardiaceae bacterium]